MDQFLRRHKIDVGVTFGILLIGAGFVKLFDFVFHTLFSAHSVLDISMAFLFILGAAAFTHREWARRFLVVLAWLALGACLLMLVIGPFSATSTLTYGDITITDPPHWKTAILTLMPAAVALVCVLALHSWKALEEFGVAWESLHAPREEA